MRMPLPTTQSYVSWLARRGYGLLFGRPRKATLLRLSLIVILLMNLRTFEYFPGFRPLQDAWYVVSLIVFFVMYPLFKIALDWTFTRFELYLLAILPVLLILPALTAQRVFGQPFYYGVFPQRSALVILWWLIGINAWRLKWFNHYDIDAVFLFTTWATYILFNAMRIVLRPGNYDQNAGFVVGYGSEASFTLTSYFAMYGTLYYTFQGIRSRRFAPYLLALLQLISALGHSGRSLAVAIVVTVVVFLFAWRGVRSSLPVLGGAVACGALLFGLSYIVDPSGAVDKAQKFADAFRVAGGASEVQDISANARIYEVNTAKPYIAEHPLFGVGSVSLQWEGGLVNALGAYFVPGDIGFVGIAFTYGLFGLFVFAVQYIFVLRSVSGGRMVERSQLADTCRGFVLLTALYSAVTGMFVFNIEVTTLFIMLVTLVNAPIGTECNMGVTKVAIGTIVA